MKLKFDLKATVIISLALLVLGGLFILKNIFEKDFIINSSNSLPHYVYRLSHMTEPITKNSIVLICNDKNKSPEVYRMLEKLHPQIVDTESIHCKGRITPLIKKIGALPGSYLISGRDREAMVDSQQLEGTIPHRTIKAFTFDGIVPADSVFVYTPHKDSLDSRYFGFISGSEIVDVLIPVF